MNSKRGKRIVIRIRDSDDRLLRLIQDITGESVSAISRIGWIMYGESLGINYKSLAPGGEEGLADKKVEK